MDAKISHSNRFIRGAFILTLAGLFSRFAGFFYRIFLSNQLGAEGMGLYQLIFPIYGICISLCCFSMSCMDCLRTETFSGSQRSS